MARAAGEGEAGLEDRFEHVAVKFTNASREFLCALKNSDDLPPCQPGDGSFMDILGQVFEFLMRRQRSARTGEVGLPEQRIRNAYQRGFEDFLRRFLAETKPFWARICQVSGIDAARKVGETIETGLRDCLDDYDEKFAAMVDESIRSGTQPELPILELLEGRRFARDADPSIDAVHLQAYFHGLGIEDGEQRKQVWKKKLEDWLPGLQSPRAKWLNSVKRWRSRTFKAQTGGEAESEDVHAIIDEALFEVGDKKPIANILENGKPGAPPSGTILSELDLRDLIEKAGYLRRDGSRHLPGRGKDVKNVGEWESAAKEPREPDDAQDRLVLRRDIQEFREALQDPVDRAALEWELGLGTEAECAHRNEVSRDQVKHRRPKILERLARHLTDYRKD